MAKFETFNLPDDLYYQPDDHFWLRVEGDLARVGMDDVAQASAQSITQMRLKPPGRPTAVGKPFGTMEAGKYVGPLRMPINGTVIETNEDVIANPSLVNSDPYGKGWAVLIQPDNLQADLANLMHGDTLQAWLEQSVADWRTRGLLR